MALPLVLLGLIGCVLLVLWVLTARARNTNALRAGATMSDTRACWICGAEDLERLADFTYRCGACGNVQGDGAAEYKQAARRAEYAKLDAEQRHHLAARLLHEAGLHLLAVEGELSNLLELSRLNLRVDGNHERERDMYDRFARALRDIHLLEHKLIDAGLMLADPVHLKRLSVDVSSMRQILDQLNLHVGGLNLSSSAELATHHDLGLAQEHVASLRPLHERLRWELGNVGRELAGAPPKTAQHCGHR